jgi:predicted adenylyl cyclase CyaB
VGRNVEIKARVRDRAVVEHRVRAIADGPGRLIEQDDSFFNCASGRLKLRCFSEDRGELIFYRRDDSAGPTQSDFVKSPTDDPASLHEALASAYGVAGVVRKRRTLYMVGQTRVHLDDVEGLGDFLELEVVLRPEQTLADGERVAHTLMALLDVGEDDLVPVAYIDLLESKK